MATKSPTKSTRAATGPARSRPPNLANYDPAPIGDTGLQQSGGYVHEEFLKELRGLQGMRVYREMADNDPTCGAILFAIRALLQRMDWNVESADENSGEAAAMAEFVEQVLSDMDTPFDSIIDEVCSMFEYGFAPMEITYKRRGGPEQVDRSQHSKFDDNKIGFRKISLRGQTTIIKWEFDEEGEITGLWQQPIAKPAVFIPMEKLALFRTTSRKNNPEGRSILRNAYRPWYFKKRIEELEAIGIERDLAGIPVARVPGRLMAPDADVTDKRSLANWRKMVQNIKRDKNEGLVLPSDTDAKGNKLYDVELMTTGGTRTFDTSKIIGRYDKAIATTVLADFIFLGQEAVGSFALSSDKTALFAEALGAFAKVIETVWNTFILPRLWHLNGLDPDLMPTLVHGDLEKPDLQVLGAFLASLSGAGMMLFPDTELEDHLRKSAGLPPTPEEGEDMRLPPPGVADSANAGASTEDA